MRWQRLKARLDKSGVAEGNVAVGSVIDETTLFLYQCIIHSSCKVCRFLTVHCESTDFL